MRVNLPRSVSSSAVALALGGAALVGCSPAPAPTPTPTPAFASEEEAFAAAEETYRAYNDTSNAERDGDSSQDPQGYLIGTALEGFIGGREFLRASGLSLQGETHIVTFRGESAVIATDSAKVTALVCLNIAAIRVFNASGQDVTPPSRPDTVAQRVTLIEQASSFLISQESEAEGEACSPD